LTTKFTHAHFPASRPGTTNLSKLAAHTPPAPRPCLTTGTPAGVIRHS